jgi:hypothetical protein
MLTIVVADTKPFRLSRIADIMKAYGANEVIMLDDTLGTIADLEQYLYPSLFALTSPVVHTRFILDAKEKELTPALIKKLLASPTIFIFEELSLSKPFATSLKKMGVDVHVPDFAEASTGKGRKDNLFGVTSLIAMQNKKDRWLAYQQAIAQYPIEAILGMLYWKVRDMALKERSDAGPYHVLYTKMLEAHSTAWQQGTPLTLAIEKALLLY